jgi:hypothetical protein
MREAHEFGCFCEQHTSWYSAAIPSGVPVSEGLLGVTVWHRGARVSMLSASSFCWAAHRRMMDCSFTGYQTGSVPMLFHRSYCNPLTD